MYSWDTDLVYVVLQFAAMGASINYVDKQGGGKGSPECQWYYISLFSKLVNEGEGGQKFSKFCQRSLWMPSMPINGYNSKCYRATILYRIRRVCVIKWGQSNVNKS